MALAWSLAWVQGRHRIPQFSNEMPPMVPGGKRERDGGRGRANPLANRGGKAVNGKHPRILVGKGFAA